MHVRMVVYLLVLEIVQQDVRLNVLEHVLHLQQL